MFLVKRDNSNKNFIIKGFITSIFLSAFIYLSYFDIEYKLLNTILGVVGLYLLISIPKKSLFVTGFIIGVSWFYWMAISLKYYDLVYLAPILLLLIGLVYGVIFSLFAIYDKKLFRVLAIFAFTFVEPFGFNWMKLELLFVDSYFSSSKLSFALILISIFLAIKLKRMKIISLLPLLFIYESPKGLYIDNPDSKISMPQLNIKQSLKWDRDYKPTLIYKNITLINDAIKNKKDLIILPETSLPTVLNQDNSLVQVLQNKSYSIDIIIGALYEEDGLYYNATYHFTKGKYTVAKKLVLVPFGEEIPLPKFFVDLINDIFYNGAKDYAKATKATDFIINNQKFRNAICYEATSDKIYENLDDVKYMIASSNNAWFTPSIEPTLQKILLKYYAKKYDITIFHVVNGSPNYVIRP